MASPTRAVDTTRSSPMMRRSRSASKQFSVYSTVVPAIMNAFHMAHWALPCMSGATTSMGMRAASSVPMRPASSTAVAIGAAPQPPPPMAAKKMSSWRHMTPLGMPVVPPV